MDVVTGALRTFEFTHYDDDKQNRRMVFINEPLDKVLTINYDHFSYMITAPVRD